jgi:hypothetical protein
VSFPLKNKFLLFLSLFLFTSLISPFAIAQGLPYLVQSKDRKIHDGRSEIIRSIFYKPSFSIYTPHLPSFFSDQVTTLNAIIPDFQVNENAGSDDIKQTRPSIDGSDNFVITWQDNRDDDYNIYAQRYSSNGIALGANFKVNDDRGSADQGYPSISVDWNGNFVITWRDKRNSNYDIYAQRYSSDGKALGTNFKVN